MSLQYTPSIPESASLKKRQIKAAMRDPAGSLSKSNTQLSKIDNRGKISPQRGYASQPCSVRWAQPSH